jgi:hypothetical protein
MSDKICCPPFDPVPWDEESHTWQDKTFLTASVPLFLHMPLPGFYGRAIGKLMKCAEKCGILPEGKDSILLTRDSSPWKTELLLGVTGACPDAKTVKMSGVFISKVFDGPYRKMPGYMIEMEDYAIAAGKKIEDWYIYYTTCPKCAKKYGHNYIVILGKVRPAS